MATKNSVLRGAKLMKKALESAKATILTAPEPIPTAKKLKLPNGEPISPAMKELLAFDGEWLGIGYDEDEHEVEAMSLEEVIEETFGEEAVPAFAEAYEMFADDCVFFQAEVATPACLYVGTADDAGEYPVITLSQGDAASVFGFVPFDVWIAQRVGLLARGATPGAVPEEYVAACQALAEANGDGRVAFDSQHRDVEKDDDGDEDEDE